MSAQSLTEKARSLRCQPTQDWRDPGLNIDLAWALSLSGGGYFAAKISRNRETKAGNRGKPEYVVTLMANEPWTLLRQVADLLDPDGPTIEDPA